ncbi:MAG TPA: ABC transporter ATP-binding protein [Planctomycetota bacterium]
MIRLHDVSKTWHSPAGAFTALRSVDLEVARGEFVAIVGRSGSGKSTLLGLIAGLDRPSSGTVTVQGTSPHTLGEARLAAWRAATVGVVFQSFQLLPTLTVAENVMLPMDLLGTRPSRQRRAHALELLARVGIAEQAHKLPLTLSGGQQQRAAIARALANDPAVITADEPTGNLDSATGAAVFALLRELADCATTVLIATHERAVPGIDRTIELVDGVIVRAAETARGASEAAGGA